ncbi:hypothetical protein QAD02_000944 [Eretmocerus hayati]|uniref:Uncharacterized protein n=1 Tax=Eretmocerus hayati TaxID=131215 RepID=A0ACC2NEQ6_9HYME|nr:hypothetical protein QAD02_000944 [Eretmocerus hayati]
MLSDKQRKDKLRIYERRLSRCRKELAELEKGELLLRAVRHLPPKTHTKKTTMPNLQQQQRQGQGQQPHAPQRMHRSSSGYSQLQYNYASDPDEPIEPVQGHRQRPHRSRSPISREDSERDARSHTPVRSPEPLSCDDQSGDNEQSAHSNTPSNSESEYSDQDELKAGLDSPYIDSDEEDDAALDIDKELNKWLVDLRNHTSKPLELSQSTIVRLQTILSAGLLENKERKELLKKISRVGDGINLEAPEMNSEISNNLKSPESTKENYLKQYQTMIGATLSEAATLIDLLTDVLPTLDKKLSKKLIRSLSNIIRVNADLRQMITIARKDNATQDYDNKIQRILKKTEPTSFLFGDDVKSLMDGARVNEIAVFIVHDIFVIC